MSDVAQTPEEYINVGIYDTIHSQLYKITTAFDSILENFDY